MREQASSRPAAGSATDRTSHVLANGLAGVAIGVLQLGVAISLAALIFTGPLEAGAGRAAAAFVLGTAIASLVIGLGTSLPTVTAGAQETAAVVAAAVAVSIAGSGDIEAGEAEPTVIVMLALAALATAVTMFVVARFGLGNLVRFLPFPVVSAFVAGTGWLLLRGGIEVMIGRTLDRGSVEDLLQWDTLRYVLPGLVLAGFMVLAMYTRITKVAISVAIIVGIAAFHLVARAVSSASVLEEDGWLIGPFATGRSWSPVGPGDIQDANWSVLADHALPIAAVVIVSVVGALLNLSGLESLDDSSVDVDRELHLTGATNGAIAVAGGLISYHLLADTVLAREVGGRGRTVPLIIAVMCGGVFVLGVDPVAQMPRAVAGGVLAGLGLVMMISWLKDSVPLMSPTDRALSGFIVVVIGAVGIITGVAVGVLVAVVAFVIRYSRIDPVRHLFAAAGRSNVDRPETDIRLLEARAGDIVAVELHGYLFFGSAVQLREAVESHFQLADAFYDDSVAEPRFLVLDLGRVSGIDSTAAGSIATLARRLDGRGIQMVLSAVDDGVVAELSRNGLGDTPAEADLDHAVAWCEDRLLGETHRSEDVVVPAAFASMVEPVRVAAGVVLIAAGARDRTLYFVEQGTLSAWTTAADGRPYRLRRVAEGAILGEVGFCTGGARTATVTADTDAVLWSLSRERFDEVVAEDPATAVALQEYLLERIADRAAATATLIRDLLR